MKFSHTLIAGLIACRFARTPREVRSISIHGKDKVITKLDGLLRVTEPDGQLSQEMAFEQTEAAKMGLLLENFALSILSPQEHKLVCSAADSLKNMALIQSAYLSSRTGMPEEPARIMSMTAVTGDVFAGRQK